MRLIKKNELILVLLLFFISSTYLNAEIMPYSASESCNYWTQWRIFKSDFISQDGRVIDWQSDKNITTSEGQSYALFFSLVANDKVMFKKLLTWSQNNLALGNISKNLPAWIWGKKEDNSYGIIDKNSASDADLWFAYTLVEAGSIWKNESYIQLGYKLLQLILDKETKHLPGLGLSILPAPYGFEISESTWRLNPSYLPLFILKRFTKEPGFSSWKNIYKTSAKTILQNSLNGTAPNWVLYSKSKQFHYTTEHSDVGSYDAIRVYLWAGMMNDNAEYKKQLIKQLNPMINHFNKFQSVPLNTFSITGSYKKVGPLGFSIALLPLLNKFDDTHILSMKNKVHNTQNQSMKKPNYYQNVLALFSFGYLDGKFKFNRYGYLETPWLNLECAKK